MRLLAIEDTTVAGAAIETLQSTRQNVLVQLSVSANYGVAEVQVNEGAAILTESATVGDLRSQDITVLTLHREHTVIPNPKDSRPIQADDRLLCFGNLEVLRGLIPTRTQRRRRPDVQPLDQTS